MTERVLVIKEEHLAQVMDEWLRRYEEDPDSFVDKYSEEGQYGPIAAAYVFELVDEMGYVQY
jgi:hypothetical protein